MTEPHLTLDDLADLLAAEAGADAEAHVAGCAGCAGRLDELAEAEAEVVAVLAALPAPPVPDDLDARLRAALDAEPALHPVAGETPAAPGRGGRAVAGGTVTPFPGAGARDRGGRRWLPVAAAGALVVTGGALAGALLLSGGGGEPSTTAAGEAGGGGGSEAEQDPFGGLTRNATGTDYAADGSLATALPALLGGSATPFTAAQRSTTADDAAEAADGPEPVLESLATADPLQDSDVAPELERLRTPAGLASCLSALLPPDEPDLRPLAVDYAAYSGEPALVVLLPATGGDAKVDVFVVGAGCTAGDDRTLFFTRLDRP